MKVLVVTSRLLATCCSVLAVSVPPDGYTVGSSMLVAVDGETGAPHKTQESRQTGSACEGICVCTESYRKVAVNCHDRRLVQVPRLDVKKRISTIILSKNSITTLDATFVQDVQLLGELESINLNFNPLRLVSGPILRSNSLKSLWMANCGLELIDPDAFSELPALEVLDLMNNRITTLTVRHFSRLDGLTSLWLHKNPLRCGCPLQRLREYCDQKGITIFIMVHCEDAAGQSVLLSRMTGYCPPPTQKTEEGILTSRAPPPGQKEKPPPQEEGAREVSDRNLSQSTYNRPSNEEAVQQSWPPPTREVNDHILSQFSYGGPNDDVAVKQGVSPPTAERTRQEIVKLLHTPNSTSQAIERTPPLDEDIVSEVTGPRLSPSSYATPSNDVDTPQSKSRVTEESDSDLHAVTVPQSKPQAPPYDSCSALLPAVAGSVVATAATSLAVVGVVLLVRRWRRKQQYVGASTLVRSWRGSPLPIIPRMPPAEYIEVTDGQSHLYEELEPIYGHITPNNSSNNKAGSRLPTVYRQVRTT